MNDPTIRILKPGASGYDESAPASEEADSEGPAAPLSRPAPKQRADQGTPPFERAKRARRRPVPVPIARAQPEATPQTGRLEIPCLACGVMLEYEFHVAGARRKA